MSYLLLEGSNLTNPNTIHRVTALTKRKKDKHQRYALFMKRKLAHNGMMRNDEENPVCQHKESKRERGKTVWGGARVPSERQVETFQALLLA